MARNKLIINASIDVNLAEHTLIAPLTLEEETTRDTKESDWAIEAAQIQAVQNQTTINKSALLSDLSNNIFTAETMILLADWLETNK